jgi:hypothetical protein
LAVFVFFVAECDGVAEFFEVVEPGDVDGFGGVFALFGVQPVFGFGERGEELFFFRVFDEGGVAVVEFAAGVVDVFFECVFAVLYL